jgi:hypothetical protein
MERTKYGFPIAIVLTAAAFVLVQSAAAATPMEEDRQVAMRLRQNTVKIEAHFRDHIENGFGFIVGEKDEGTLYVATPYHVVSKADDVTGEKPTVKVELFGEGEMSDAKLLGFHDAHDLAVITFQAPEGFKWNRKCLGSDEQQGEMTRVWFIGKKGDWLVPTSPGTISGVAPVDGIIEIDRLDIRPGSSGGPLVASSGIVGMVLEDSPDGSRALSIQYIKEQFNRWHQAFTLESSGRPSKQEPAQPSHAETPQPPTTVPATPTDALAAKGAAIASRDPLFAALRALQPEGPARLGFDHAMVAALNQTQWGPGKQGIVDSLSGDEQEGFRVGAYIAVDRNNNDQWATIGAAIADADPAVAQARTRNSDPRYWLGFDIATGIFGDPKKGAQGNKSAGTGSLGIRNALLSPLAQKGFNAGMAYHLSHRY